jgi:hypothetical protein
VCRTVCSNADRQSVCVGKLRWLLAKWVQKKINQIPILLCLIWKTW